MRHDPLDQTVGFLLQRASQIARAITAEALAALGLSPRQAAVLDLLTRQEPLTQQELGEILRIDRTSIVALIDGMEKQGFVVRGAHPRDRRAYALVLTEAGRQVAGTARQVIERSQDDFLDPLTPEEWNHLRGLLIKLTDRPTCPAANQETPTCPTVLAQSCSEAGAEE